MNKSAWILGFAFAVICGHCHAQTFIVSGPSPTAAGNDLYEFTLDVSGAEGIFDTFELVLESDGLFNQVGDPAQGIAGRSEDSGFSGFLYCAACFGGQGLSPFGLDASTDTPSLVQATFASLGDNSASTQGNYLVAQVVMAPGGGGTHSFRFFDDGSQVGISGTGIPFGVPEPSTLTFLVLGSLALVSRSCRGLQRGL